MLYDSCGDNRFEGNSFVGNMTPLTLVGRRTDTNFDGNYWSDNDAPDLDGDGRSDRPYRLSTVFDHFRGEPDGRRPLHARALRPPRSARPSARSPCSSPSPPRTALRSRVPRRCPRFRALRLHRVAPHLAGVLASAAAVGLGSVGLWRGRR